MRTLLEEEINSKIYFLKNRNRSLKPYLLIDVYVFKYILFLFFKSLIVTCNIFQYQQVFNKCSKIIYNNINHTCLLVCYIFDRFPCNQNHYLYQPYFLYEIGYVYLIYRQNLQETPQLLFFSKTIINNFTQIFFVPAHLIQHQKYDI